VQKERGMPEDGQQTALIQNARAVTPSGGARAGQRSGNGARRESCPETVLGAKA